MTTQKKFDNIEAAKPISDTIASKQKEVFGDISIQFKYEFQTEGFKHLKFIQNSDETIIKQTWCIDNDNMRYIRTWAEDNFGLSNVQMDGIIYYGYRLLSPTSILLETTKDNPISFVKNEKFKFEKSPFEKYKPQFKYSSEIRRTSENELIEYKQKIKQEEMLTMWNEWKEETILTPSFFMRLNQVPFEYMAIQDMQEDEEDENYMQTGQVIHEVIPLLYYNNNKKNDIVQFIRNILQAIYGEIKDDKIKYIMTTASVLLQGIKNKIIKYQNKKWNFFEAYSEKNNNWIMFDSYLGPINFGSWGIMSKPDIIIKIDNRILILEIKTHCNIYEVQNYDITSYYTAKPTFDIKTSYHVSSQIMLLFSHYILNQILLKEKDSKVKTTCFTVCLSKTRENEIFYMIEDMKQLEKIMDTIQKSIVLTGFEHQEVVKRQISIFQIKKIPIIVKPISEFEKYQKQSQIEDQYEKEICEDEYYENSDYYEYSELIDEYNMTNQYSRKFKMEKDLGKKIRESKK